MLPRLSRILLRQTFIYNCSFCYTLRNANTQKLLELHRSLQLPSSTCLYSTNKNTPDVRDDLELKKILVEINRDFEVKQSSNDQKDFLASESDQHDLNYDKTKSSDAQHNEDSCEDETDVLPKSWSDVTSVKYEQFDPSGSRIIYDISEEELGLAVPQERRVRPEFEPKKPGLPEHINLNRGTRGVFDIGELVSVMEEENAIDFSVMKISREIHYVEHMVVASARSQQHLNAVAMIVRQVYNKKKHRKDPILIVEGKGSNWVAMDLGNIALHIMSPNMRRRVDLESLWLLGPEHDIKLTEEVDVEDPSYIFSLVDPELREEKQRERDQTLLDGTVLPEQSGLHLSDGQDGGYENYKFDRLHTGQQFEQYLNGSEQDDNQENQNVEIRGTDVKLRQPMDNENLRRKLQKMHNIDDKSWDNV